MMTYTKSARNEAREARLRAALRENLKRRKAQARERSSPEHGQSAGPTHDSAEIIVDKRKG
jgi:hypothetical protein